jgi:hypothetical protein
MSKSVKKSVKTASHKDFLSSHKAHKKWASTLGGVRSIILQSEGYASLKQETRVLRASKKNSELYEAIKSVVRTSSKGYNTYWTLQAVRKYMPAFLLMCSKSDTEKKRGHVMFKEDRRKFEAAKKAAEKKAAEIKKAA